MILDGTMMKKDKQVYCLECSFGVRINIPQFAILRNKKDHWKSFHWESVRPESARISGCISEAYLGHCQTFTLDIFCLYI